jgi:uncharacterized protein YbjT (DUF2867 family)
MTARILLTGGTGTLGRHVVPLLEATGIPLRVLSRREHPSTDGVEFVVGDLVRNAGIAEAVADTGTVLHLAGGRKGDDVATGSLARAAKDAGVAHLVMISVIGADRMPLGYFRSKLRAERAALDSGVPSTILRAAQFHELVLSAVRALTKPPVAPVPASVRLEPVDPRDVAVRLVELTAGRPSGLVADLPGPDVASVRELVDGYLAAAGKRRPVMPIPLGGKAGRAYRAGWNLSAGTARGSRTWERFLAERLASESTRVGEHPAPPPASGDAR